jgi:hypothetical protein
MQEILEQQRADPQNGPAPFIEPMFKNFLLVYFSTFALHFPSALITSAYAPSVPN